MRLTLLPLLAALHLRYPSYNAVSVLELTAASAPEALATTALAPDSLSTPARQDTPEIALPMTVIPWAVGRRLPVYGLAEPPADPNAEADFRHYLARYPAGQARLREVDAALDDLRATLNTALTLARITAELLPRLAAYHHLRERLFEDGPGTGWLRARVAVMAQRLLTLPQQRVTVLVCLDHLPFLHEALAGRADLAAPPEITASDAARERSLLDYAFLGEAPDPTSLLAQLREIRSPEARYHEANLLLAHGHAAEALELLEVASRGDFSRPYFLPGYLLARLGQLYDLAGQRDKAVKAYRAVRALAWAPAEALLAAQEGLQSPFSGATSAR
ncbi:MAG: hypothetical protein KGZ60_11030 [Truepera sp.]|nr:hypothetical protein [Truepera sp.]